MFSIKQFNYWFKGGTISPGNFKSPWPLIFNRLYSKVQWWLKQEKKLEKHFIDSYKLFLLSLFLSSSAGIVFLPYWIYILSFPTDTQEGQEKVLRLWCLYLLVRALIERKGVLSKGQFDEVSFIKVGCGSHREKCSGLWPSSIPAVTPEALMTGREQYWCEDTHTACHSERSGLCLGTEPAGGDLAGRQPGQ